MDERRTTYEKPAITGKQGFETHALSCNKVPGLGDANFCGEVWTNHHGVGNGCTMNPSTVSRSS